MTFNHAGSCVIDANQAGDAAWLPATQAQQVITVPQATPALTWPQPANIVHGAPVGITQLDATANVPGTFTYSPAGRHRPGGRHPYPDGYLSRADTTNYTSGGTVSTQITVLPRRPRC